MTENQTVRSDPTKSSPRPSRAPLIYYGVAFALLGLCVGVFAGLSHSPVIGVLLPLLFGLIGGANGIYLARVDLTNEQDRRRLSLVGCMLSVFLIFVLAGSFYGILVRTGSGLSALSPRLQLADDATIRPVALPDLEALDAGTALELALLRYRLRVLGADVQEQQAILAAAREALVTPMDREQLAGAFEHLLTLAEQIYTLLSEQEQVGLGRPFAVGEIQVFVAIKLEQYRWLAAQLPQHNVPIDHLVDLIDEDREEFSMLIREQQWGDERPLTQWLLNHPEIRQKLWELELAYIDTSYELRDLGWLSGQPLAEAIDQLIQASGAPASPGAETDIVSEARGRTGFAR